jgi:redox-sensitive bicupin YhaK (pirin superfamily)
MSGADPLSELKPAMSTSDVQHIETRDSVLGEDLMIRRALPSRLRRTVGAWCFFDHFGPVDTSGGRGMRVGPHPHIGLQTFTWPIAGEILHRDSLGYEQVIRPGAVNLMTAGRGISHSEESPEPRSPILHGAQLWIALPEAQRRMAPSFEHYPSVPALERDGFKLTILVGELLGERSPVRVHTPMVGLELLTQDAAHSVLPLRSDFEHALLVLEGALQVDGETLLPGTLLYLPPGRERVAIATHAAARTLLIGGEPFREELLIWWNFVARTRQEIEQATRDWNEGKDYFGSVQGYDGARLVAPPPPWITETGVNS